MCESIGHRPLRGRCPKRKAMKKKKKRERKEEKKKRKRRGKKLTFRLSKVEGGWGPWYKIPNQALVHIFTSNFMSFKVFKTGPKTKISNFN